MPETFRTCRQCGASFSTAGGRTVYCSGLCAQKWHNKKQPAPKGGCHGCGTSLMGTTKFMWCSRACKRKHFAYNAWDRDCQFCGKRFTARQAIQRYCSRSCRKKASYTRVYPDGYYREHCCGWCRKAYMAKDHRSVFCCKSCRNKHYHYTKRLGSVPGVRGWRYGGDADEAVVTTPKPVKPKPVVKVVAVKPAAKEVIPDYPIGATTGKGFSYSGYSEAAPRQAVTTVSGCPTCRASGKDYQGRIVHSSWCKEAAYV